MPANRSAVAFEPWRQIFFAYLLSPLVLAEVKHGAEYIIYRAVRVLCFASRISWANY